MPWAPMESEMEFFVRLHDVKESASWEATHAFNKELLDDPAL